MGNLAFRTLVGFIGGLLAWMVMEPGAASAFSRGQYDSWEKTFVMILGLVIGVAVGGLNGFLRGGKRHTLMGAGLGALFGAVGIVLGYSIGGQISQGLFGRGWTELIPFPIKIIPRTLAIAPMATLLGAGIGASSLNVRSIRNGALGGLLAGIAAGLVFDTISGALGPFILQMRGQTSGEIGLVGRAIMALLIGGMIALFIGIVERVTRSAWVRLTLGRNEGKEWVVDSAQTFIGRSERAQIPLFGDPNVAPMHACIVRQGPQQYLLTDGGTPGGTFLNGQPVSQAPLFHGAQIRIGSFNLEFLMKNAPIPVRGPEAYAGQSYPYQGAPQQPVPVTPQPAHPVPMQTQAYPAQQMPTQAYPQSPAGQPTMAYTPEPSGGFSLIALDGPLSGQRYGVVAPLEVGREAPGIPMGFDTMASRRHASVAPHGAGLVVTDLGSTNGTYVNGQRVQSQTVRPGDLVKIGATTFRVEAV
jgi:pSer/pThr/pTyr-binding forkhead associated (FHA) protein